MNVLTRLSRFITTCGIIAMFLAAGLSLSACGDKEPEQRAAFIILTEKNILSKSGVRYTPFTEDQKKMIGSEYLQQYELLTALHTDKEFEDKFTRTFIEVQKGLKFGPSEQMLPLVTKSFDMLEEARNFIKQKQQELQAKREAFSQPEDLKAVYDKAFGKMVTTPLDAVQEAFADTMEALEASAALHNYILEHPGAGKFSGMILNIEDRSHEKKLKELLEDMNAKARKTQEAVKKLNAAIR